MLLKGSWRIVRIAGVGVYLHWSFSLILLWLVWYGATGRRPWQSILFLALLGLLLFGCVALHELAHALMARRLDMVVKNVVILPVGGLVQIETRPEQPLNDLLIALAGPLANLILATGTALLLWLFKQAGFLGRYVSSPHTVLEGLFQSGRPHEILIALALFLLIANGILFAFNLIPAFPLDGGRIVRALLAMLIAYERATQLTRWLGQGMAVLLLVAAFLFNSLGLFFLGGLILVTGVTMKVGS